MEDVGRFGQTGCLRVVAEADEFPRPFEEQLRLGGRAGGADFDLRGQHVGQRRRDGVAGGERLGRGGDGPLLPLAVLERQQGERDREAVPLRVVGCLRAAPWTPAGRAPFRSGPARWSAGGAAPARERRHQESAADPVRRTPTTRGPWRRSGPPLPRSAGRRCRRAAARPGEPAVWRVPAARQPAGRRGRRAGRPPPILHLRA